MIRATLGLLLAMAAVVAGARWTATQLGPEPRADEGAVLRTVELQPSEPRHSEPPAAAATQTRETPEEPEPATAPQAVPGKKPAAGSAGAAGPATPPEPAGAETAGAETASRDESVAAERETIETAVEGAESVAESAQHRPGWDPAAAGGDAQVVTRIRRMLAVYARTLRAGAR